jgi:hypothetical protein
MAKRLAAHGGGGSSGGGDKMLQSGSAPSTVCTPVWEVQWSKVTTVLRHDEQLFDDFDHPEFGPRGGAHRVKPHIKEGPRKRCSPHHVMPYNSRNVQNAYCRRGGQYEYTIPQCCW